MNDAGFPAGRLLAHFERVAEAPDAIPRLRRFILDLAVRGKLVPQDSTDEPAEDLLKRIAAAKARLVEAGTRRRRAPLSAVDQDEMPFNLPQTWRWVRFANISDFSAGRTPSRNDTSFWNNGDHAWASIADLESGQVLTRTKETVSDKARQRVFGSDPEPPGTIIMSFKLTIGKIARLGIPAFHNEAIISIRPHLSAIDSYLFKILPQFARQGTTKGAIKGATLNRDSISNIVVPLPPLAEQRRIVAKVEELMALCDQLEAARKQREARRDRLTAASLARLNAPDPETFRDDARSALDALPTLTARPDQIRQLRQAILNLAVRGKLVPQSADDEPAPVFDRTLPVDLEKSFDAPKNWAWARLHTLGKLKGGGTPSKARDDYWNGDIPWISPKDMKIDYLSTAQLCISNVALENSAAALIETGSILFVVRGMILVHSFPVAVTRVPLAINQDMKALEPKKPEMAEYLLRALKGLKPEMLKRVQRSSHGTCRLEGSDYKDFLVPIPPISEQHRIVAKADELMALCDQLEASLATDNESRGRLLDALLHEALGSRAAA